MLPIPHRVLRGQFMRAVLICAVTLASSRHRRRQDGSAAFKLGQHQTLRPGKEVIGMKHHTKAVIAFRKVCKAKGTGLSHYILMAGKEK